MTFVDWIAGVLVRPGETFEKSRHGMRFGYWWILLSTFTLEIVTVVFSPPVQGQEADTDFLILFTVTALMVLFDVQAVLLLAVTRAFHVMFSWAECLKYIGLAWSLLLVEDIFTFYWALKGNDQIVLWAGIPFFLWYVYALTSGVRRLSGVPWWKALAVTLLASCPWRAGLMTLALIH